jgi:chemotaxis protein methyltransferase CheR
MAYRREVHPYNEPLRTLSGNEFEQLSGLIRDHCGIKMPVPKKIMLESRLQKRLRVLGISSFREYCDLLFKSPDGAGELVNMIDAVTTNKTGFFREPAHFSFLAERLLPEFRNDCDQRMEKKITIWSAGCATGEEPYTLAIVLSEFAALYPGLPFSIVGTDISTKALEKARLGIYDRSQTTMIPAALLQKYFLRSKDKDKGTVRIVPELRFLVQFQRQNLMDAYSMPHDGALDAIFCRNVIIYFERKTQHLLLHRLCRSLKTGGYLFMGHSETVHGFDLPLVRIASTIYKKAA